MAGEVRTLFLQRMNQLGLMQNWRVKDPKNPEPETPWRAAILQCYDLLTEKLQGDNVGGKVYLVTAPLELAKGGRMLETQMRVSGAEENYRVAFQQCAERKMLLENPETKRSDLQRHEEALRTRRKGPKQKPPEQQVRADLGLPGADYQRAFDTWIFYTTASPCRLCGTALAQGFGVWYSHLVVAFEGCYGPIEGKTDRDEGGNVQTITKGELKIPDNDFFELETDDPEQPGIEMFKVFRDPINCDLMKELNYGMSANQRKNLPRWAKLRKKHAMPEVDWRDVPSEGLPRCLPSEADGELRIYRVTRGS